MNDSMKALIRRVTKYLLRFAILAIAFFAGETYEWWNWPKWPNGPDCQLSVVARYPNPDATDLASVLKRDCDMAETIDYFVRLDIHAKRRPGDRGWWLIRDLENDAYPVGDPTVVWTSNSAVQVTVSTEALSGKIVRRFFDGVELVRIYQPRDPNPFSKR